MNTAKHASVKLFFMEFPDPSCRRGPPPQRPESLLALAHITGPMIQGANSSSPTPESSLLLLLPEATARTSSKICRPTTGSGVPSRITPQLMSMSSSMWRYTREVVASLMDGTGLQPETDPRPVGEPMMLHPPAPGPGVETGAWPGVSTNTQPRVVMGSPQRKTSLMGVVPP